MRWPGTIQPSRFLSHTGYVLPGVRRIVNVSEPAVATEWSVAVPAGVQWRILGGTAALHTDATVANRQPNAIVTIEGVQVSSAVSPATITAGSDVTYTAITDVVVANDTVHNDKQGLIYPFVFIPQGGTIGTSGSNLQAGDQWSAIALWVEEVYVTDAQLSEAARIEAELNREIAQYEFQQAEQAGG